MKKGEVTTDTTDTQRPISNYCKQLFASKMDNLREMDKFLERDNFQRLKHVEIENMNTWITEIETVILKLQTNKSPEPDGFTDEFYQTSRKELKPILLKLFQKIIEEGILSRPLYKWPFYKATISLIPKLNKDPTHKKEIYRPISLMNKDTKILNKILRNWIQQYIKRIIHMIKWYLSWGCKDSSTYVNQPI